MTSSELAIQQLPHRPVAEAPRPRRWRAARDRTLHAPLLVKLLGANLFIAVAAVGAAALWGHLLAVAITSVALALGVVVNARLVQIALTPLDELQQVAERVSRGEEYARVRRSVIADERVEHLGLTFNRLLDKLTADQAHIHALIRRSLKAREAERAELARLLRDDTAQHLTAVVLQLAAIERTLGNDEERQALHGARDLLSLTLDDVRRVADATYPGLLHELGLPAALEALAARVRARSTLQVSVDVALASMPLSPSLVTAMYYAAEEAVRNAERHANARSVQIRLAPSNDLLRLDVVDDGGGFDAASTEREPVAIGLFQVRELLAGAHGHLAIESFRGRGTRVTATARFDQGDTS